MTASQQLKDALTDRRMQLIGASIGMVLFLGWVAFAVATGDLRTVMLAVAVIAAPFLVALAYLRPYLFPYGLYIAMQPFENLLGGGPSGSLVKLLGACGTAVILYVIFRERRLVRPPGTLAIAAVYVLWVLLSSIWAIDAGAALTDAQTIFSLVAMFAVVSSAPIGERDLRIVCGAIIAGGVAASLYGIWYFLQFPPTDDGRLAIQIAGRAIDSNQFADGLLAPIALALVGLLHARKIHLIIGSLFVLTILSEGVIISLSREAMFGVLAVALVTVIMSRRRLLGLALLVPFFAVIPLIVPNVASRFMTALSTGGAGRTAIWQVDIHAWASHPIIGWGAGSAFQAYNAHLLQVAPRLFAGWSRPPHNAPLHVLVDTGLIGFTLVVLAYFLTFRQLKPIRRDDPLYDLRVGLTASLVAIGVVSFFIDNATDKSVWIIICAVAQLRTVVRSRNAAVPALSASAVRPSPAVRFAR